MKSTIETEIRTELQELMKQLPEAELHAAKRYLQFLLEKKDAFTPEGHRQGSLAALQEVVRSFTPLPPDESGFDLTRFLMEERKRSITDYRNPVTEK